MFRSPVLLQLDKKQALGENAAAGLWKSWKKGGVPDNYSVPIWSTATLVYFFDGDILKEKRRC